MSFYTMAFMGTAPFGSFLAGSLAKIIGAPYTLLIGGITCISGAVLFARRLPELENIIRPIFIKMGIITEGHKGFQLPDALVLPPED
jgi:hypothetical protein